MPLLGLTAIVWCLLGGESLGQAAVTEATQDVSGASGTAPRLELTGELHGSLLSGLAEASILDLSFGAGLRAGVRLGPWIPFLHNEINVWPSVNSRGSEKYAVWNVALGGAYAYADGLMRSSVAMGASVLISETQLDESGSVGLFFEIRPAAFRWDLGASWRLGLAPLTFDLVAPVLGGLPLVKVQYRTVLSLELTP